MNKRDQQCMISIHAESRGNQKIRKKIVTLIQRKESYHIETRRMKDFN